MKSLKLLAKKILLISSFGLIAVIANAQNLNGPTVSVSSSYRTVQAGESVRVTVSFSEPVVRFTASQISVDGGSVESVRKLSPTSYTVFVRAGENSRYLDVQVQSGAVVNAKGIDNEYASRDFTIRVTPIPTVQPGTVGATESEGTLSSLLNSLLRSSQSATTNSTTNTTQAVTQTTQTTPAVTYVNCNGVSIPSTQGCNASTYNPYQQTGGYYDMYGNYIPAQNTYSPYATNPYATTPYGYTSNPYANPYGTPYAQQPITTNPYNTYYSPYTTAQPYSYDSYNSAPGVYTGYTTGVQTYSEPYYTQPAPRRSLFDVLFGY